MKKLRKYHFDRIRFFRDISRNGPAISTPSRDSPIPKENPSDTLALETGAEAVACVSGVSWIETSLSVTTASVLAWSGESLAAASVGDVWCSSAEGAVDEASSP